MRLLSSRLTGIKIVAGPTIVTMISNLFRSFIALEKHAVDRLRGVELNHLSSKRSMNLEHLFRFLEPFF